MRILVADDDSVSRQVLIDALKEWGHVPVSAQHGIEALKLLQDANPPQLLILDWMMPLMNGIDVCRYVRSTYAANPYVYILMLTSMQKRKDLVEALKAGADDFIRKPFDPEELLVRIRAAARILELQTELLKKARHDSLTGLLNHDAILEELRREFSRSRRERKPLSILLADLDHFKAINDTHGHQTGDSILQKAAERFRSVLRCYDHIGRYGGEEFLIVLPGCSIEDADRLSHRLRKAIRGRISEVEEHSIPFTISIGVACVQDFSSTSPEQMIAAADQALYKAKQKGRNRVELAISP
jgi:diguanylate cyclase (GGDEF)-like protein